MAVAWIALGLVLDARGTVLGTPLPPFNVAWQPRLAEPAWLAATIALFALAVVLAPRVLAARIHPLAFAAGLLAFTLALRLALAAARAGTQVYDRVFDYTRNGYAKNEYLGALDALTYGTGYLLDRFAELVPALPVHAAGHPPGILLAIAWLDLDTPGRLAAACIAAGALAVPLTYAIGRELLAERDARAAALLMALAPGGLIFATTSADALYLGLGALAAWPLAARGLAARALGAMALALGTLFAWSLLAVGAWAALIALRRDGLRSAIVLGVLCAAALAAVLGGLAALTGYDPIGTLRATESVYRLSIASERPYAFWLLGSPVAFLVALGIPIAWLALRGLAAGETTAIAIFAVIAIASVAGFTKAETERIWLFLAPMVCLAAAPHLRRPALVAAALGVQAVAFELAFGSQW